MEEITRQIRWNVDPWMNVLLYGGVFAALGLSAWRQYKRVKVWQLGTARWSRSGSKGLSSYIWNILKWVSGKGRMAQDPFAGVMHFLVLWGFIILFIGTTLVFLEDETPLHFFYGTFYLYASLIIDLGGAAFLIGLFMAVYRRYVARARRIKPSLGIGCFLILMILITLTGHFLEAARIGVDLAGFEKYSVIGYPLALFLRGAGMQADGLRSLHQGLWISHAVLCIAFFGAAMMYFFRHMIFSLASVALQDDPLSTGRLRGIPVNGRTPGGPPGGPPLGTVGTLSWKDMLDGDGCTNCGRCTSVCPATQAGKELDPRNVVQEITSLVGRHIRSADPPSIFEQFDPEKVLWDCTTCGACSQACPVHIEVFDKIIDLRRQLVEEGRISESARNSLESLQTRQNPWDYPPQQREAWSEALRLSHDRSKESGPPEYIYWIGCAGAFEPSAQKVSRAMVEILRQADVDFMVLGAKEACTGDPARRLGDEALFQDCKQRNLATLEKTGAKKVITHCPHCFNTFKNEYQTPDKPSFEVIHHSQLLQQLIRDGKIEFDAGSKKDAPDKSVTFHDPCYLGRHNGEVDAPRAVIASIPGLKSVEMKQSGENSLCCGGGGGRMWLEDSGKERIENLRLEEARQTGAKMVATACPFCKIMFEGASAQDGPKLELKDISELVVESMKS